MAADDLIRRLAIEQRKRLIASILGHAEQTFWQKLTPRERDAFRAKVLAAANSYHDFILDCIKVNRDDTIRNEASIELIEAIHRSQQRLEEELLRG